MISAWLGCGEVGSSTWTAASFTSWLEQLLSHKDVTLRWKAWGYKLIMRSPIRGHLALQRVEHETLDYRHESNPPKTSNLSRPDHWQTRKIPMGGSYGSLRKLGVPSLGGPYNKDPTIFRVPY